MNWKKLTEVRSGTPVEEESFPKRAWQSKLLE